MLGFLIPNNTFLCGCLLSALLWFNLVIGILFLCAKKKPAAPDGRSLQSKNSVKKNDSEKPSQASVADPVKEKSKQADPKKKAKPGKPPVPTDGKTADPFEQDGDSNPPDGVETRTETSQKMSNKKKKAGKPGKLGLPNKDGYDDLNPNNKKEDDAKSKINTEETKSKMVAGGKDDGYDAIDPTKNVNLENVNMNEPKEGGNSNAVSPAATPPAAPSTPTAGTPGGTSGGANKPRMLPRDAKQQKIAKGAKKGKGDYPTFDDVLSDWDSKKEPGDKSKVKKPQPADKNKKSTMTDANSEKEEKFELKSRAKSLVEKTQSEMKKS